MLLSVVSYKENCLKGVFALKTMNLIKRILSRACVYFTVTALLLYTVGMLFSGIEREWIPTLEMMYMILAFSVLFSAVNQIVLPSSLPGFLKVLIHYAATTAVFYVIFILWGGFNASASAVFLILLAYTLIYAVISLVYYLIRYACGLKQNNKSSYKSQFSDNRTKK